MHVSQGILCLFCMHLRGSELCSMGCVRGYCTNEGTCINGCKEGYETASCGECSEGYYMSDSEAFECIPCSVGCEKGSCDTINGRCDCETGYRGYRCDTCADGYFREGNLCAACSPQCEICTSDKNCIKCENGLYGRECGTRCSPGCNNNNCAIDGKCLEGCNDLWEGDLCNQCIGRKWGQVCTMDCPDNCDRCLSDTDCGICKPRFYGTRCQLSCPDGCIGACGKVTGVCTDCKAGYSGDMCCIQNNRCSTCLSSTICEKCIPGYFGEKCNNECKDNCLTCSVMEYCDTCKQGRYGVECDMLCPENCLECTEESKCDPCKDSFFGSDCSGKCVANCRKCINDTICLVCFDGYYGENCENTCRTCADDACARYTGLCLNGCREGYEGPRCQDATGSGASVVMSLTLLLAALIIGEIVHARCIGSYH